MGETYNYLYNLASKIKGYNCQMAIEEIESNPDDWMIALLRSPIFKRLPPVNVQKILMALEDVHFKKDEVILTQGSEGDYYYLIKNGECLLTRKPSPKAKEIRLAQLTTGDTFGEDALISGAVRSLTVTALTDISLLRLDRQLFLSLIKNPTLKFVNYSEMQSAIKQGSVLLDVRTPDEYVSGHLDGSINEPFFSLRMQLKKLNREKPYIVVCENGKISAAAVFVLLNNKIEATVLKGGMAGITPEQENGSAIFSTRDDIGGIVSDTAFKTIFFQYFEPLVDDCCTRIDFEFGLQLGKGREKMSKDYYMKLLEYLCSVRHDIKRDYLLKVNDIFDGSYQVTTNNQTEQIDFSKVTLTSDIAVTESQSIARIIRHCEHLFHNELTRLNRQFPNQSEKQMVVGSQNPVSPEKLVHALVEVVKSLKLNTENQIVLYNTFQANVFSQLGVIYRELLNSQ